MTTERDPVHERIVEAFAAGWADIDSRALDDIMADEVVLVQPMIPTCHGKRQWWARVEALQTFAADLRSDVLSWSGAANRLYIEHRLSAVIGGRTVVIDAVDSFEIDDAGRIVRRTAYFDPARLIWAVLTTPSVWVRWWRSGLRPSFAPTAGNGMR
ncbi:nuclear transport factor 2 family protein [Nocardia fusca]|uniref:nuclear transport factor 2 family protein n=1 Tax=Nocardia fusca TaxID=941183 RepID=UPI0037CB1BB5